MKKTKGKPTACKPVTSFKIDRSKWLCGELFYREGSARKLASESVLLDEYGRMCCLGFYAKACDIPPAKLLNLPAYDYMKDVSALPSTLIDRCNAADMHADMTITAEKLLVANDVLGSTAGAREKEVSKLFQKAGISVSFVGKYPVVKREDY